MISDDLGQALHDRATRGEQLSDEEQGRLESWYEYQDNLESNILSTTAEEKTIAKLQSQIEVALTLGEPVLTNCDCPQPATPQAQQPETATAVPTPADTATTEVIPTPAESAATETVETIPSAPETEPIVSWQDAAAYEGQIVMVVGLVVDTYNSGSVVFLNFDEDYRNTFKVAIFPDAWPLFPAPPEEYYRGQTVQVTGQIKMYQNAPEIIVDQLEQIEMVE